MTFPNNLLRLSFNGDPDKEPCVRCSHPRDQHWNYMGGRGGCHGEAEPAENAATSDLRCSCEVFLTTGHLPVGVPGMVLDTDWNLVPLPAKTREREVTATCSRCGNVPEQCSCDTGKLVPTQVGRLPVARLLGRLSWWRRIWMWLRGG